MAQLPVRRPLAEGDVCHELGLGPVGVPHPGRVGKRRLVTDRRRQPGVQVLEDRAGEAGSDLAGIAQTTVAVEIADEQGTQVVPLPPRIRVTPDDELLAGAALQLAPVG